MARHPRGSMLALKAQFSKAREIPPEKVRDLVKIREWEGASPLSKVLLW